MSTEENKKPEENEELSPEEMAARDAAKAYEMEDSMSENTEDENDPYDNDAPETLDDDAAHDVLVKLQEENAQLKDQVLRALAEAENTRKRSERSQADASKFAVTGFAKDMLDVADNLRRALDAIPEDQRDGDLIKNLIEGVEATERVMLQNFEKHGIQKIEPIEGRFDPNFHEVMFEADMPDQKPGNIIQLIEPGYVLNGRLLRPARVGVAKGGVQDTKIDEEI